MEQTLLQLAYLVASIFFILSLQGLSSQESARQGNRYGVIGMSLAIIATLLNSHVDQYYTLIPLLLIGAGIGYWRAKVVEMTQMPELVALLHSFVGAAAVLVGFASDRGIGHEGGHAASSLYGAEVAVDIMIGAITFTGSVVAFLKLRGGIWHPTLKKIPYLQEIAGSKPLLLKNRHQLNAGAAIACLGLIAYYASCLGAEGASSGHLGLITLITIISGALGVHLVVAIGGADMPVVVSMLNSYSGWTASAAGFMLNNDLLIITGALVGSSGAILSYIMCRSMNRSIWAVIFGGFGAEPEAAPAPSSDEPQEERSVTEIEAEELSAKLAEAKSVVIVPGYGLAQARAQNEVYTLTNLLKDRGVDVRFAIHPVAGRLPGHMNILLAEANVPYDIVLELDEINEDFPETDVVLVIGANDIVNPLTQQPGNPISGMEVLEVWKSEITVVFKRSRNVGYAGIDNPLFYHENNRMFFGDAKQSVNEIISALQG